MRVLLAIALLAAVQLEHARANVVDVAASSFASTVRSRTHVLMEFYAPWCGHCKRLEPEYTAAAALLERLPQPVLTARVDATADGNDVLAKWYKIRGFPTILLFQDGKRLAEYAGARKADALAQWVADTIGAQLPIDSPAAAPVASNGGVAPAGSPDQPAGDSRLPEVVSFSNATTLRLLRGDINLKQKWFLLALTPGPDSHAHASALRLLRPCCSVQRDAVLVMTVDARDEQVAKLLHPALLPRGHGATTEDAAAMRAPAFAPVFLARVARASDGGEALHLFTYSPPALGDTDSASAAGEAPDSSHLTEWVAAVVSSTQQADLGGAASLAPTAVVPVHGDIFSPITSAPRPASGDWDASGALQLVADSFRSLAVARAAAGSAVLVEIYAPWCKHCQSLAPALHTAAASLRDAVAGDTAALRVIVAQLDGTVNEVQGVRAQGYPTLLLLLPAVHARKSVAEGAIVAEAEGVVLQPFSLRERTARGVLAALVAEAGHVPGAGEQLRAALAVAQHVVDSVGQVHANKDEL